MIEFSATKSNGYSERFAADSWNEAHEICEMNDWKLDGEIIATIPADQTTIQSVIDFCHSLENNRGH